MDLYYKHFELPSFKINGSGYLIPWTERLKINYRYSHTGEVSDFIVSPVDNFHYCPEADIISKIILNEEGYFDFNKAILDIGAYVGYYSFKTPFKYVYAFEPNKVMFTLLNTNLLMHDKLDNSQTFNVLLSDKHEDVRYDGFSVDSEEYMIPIDEDKVKIVSTKILDEYAISNIGLIKIDVEGMEEKVLRGGLKTIINNNYPPILFECWKVGFYGMTQEQHDSLQKFLEDLGYKIYWNWGNYETHLALRE